MNATDVTIGERVRYLRNKIGLRQKEFAEKSGISRSLLSMIETDKRMPSNTVMKILSTHLEVSEYYLLTGIEDKNHLAFEELGLSNESISILKKENKREGLHYKQKAIDLLLSYSPLLLLIYVYLTTDYHRIETVERILSPEDIERFDRLSILDELKTLREKTKMEERK